MTHDKAFTLFALIVTASVSAPVTAAPVFPPAHLNASAAFSSGTASVRDPADAWYHAAGRTARTGLINGEAKQVSPYPSVYYFYKLRNYANDESARIRDLEGKGTSVPIDIVSNTEGSGHDS